METVSAAPPRLLDMRASVRNWGATVRMPALADYFGDGGWSGIFGPVAVLGFGV